VFNPATIREGSHDQFMRSSDMGIRRNYALRKAFCLSYYKTTEADKFQSQRMGFKILHMSLGIPTAVKVLQEWLFRDFMFMLAYYDEEVTGCIDCDGRLLRPLSMSFLRLAA
jgi:hypothetical protein